MIVALLIVMNFTLGFWLGGIKKELEEINKKLK